MLNTSNKKHLNMKDNRHLYTYKYFHQSKDFQLKPERIKKIIKKIMEHDNPHFILDVGCGLGAVVNELRGMGKQAEGVDFAPDLKGIWGEKDYFQIADARDLPYDDKSFYVVLSSDFFEHINEEDIDKVANEMKRVVMDKGKVLAFVADDIGGYLNRRQRDLHVTYKPLEWWKEKLKGIEVFSAHEYAD